MACCPPPPNLPTLLEQSCEKIRKPRCSVLFRRGEKPFGVFLLLSGAVSLDLGIDQPLVRYYGPGALLGLSATLTKHNYSMTATATEDAEVGFLSNQVLDSLIRNNADFCRYVLTMLSERMLEIQKVKAALLNGEKQTSWEKQKPARPDERDCSTIHRLAKKLSVICPGSKEGKTKSEQLNRLESFRTLIKNVERGGSVPVVKPDDVRLLHKLHGEMPSFFTAHAFRQGPVENGKFSGPFVIQQVACVRIGVKHRVLF